MASQSKKRGERILVFQLGHIGDTVVSLPALRAIRRHFGLKAEIWLMHEAESKAKAIPKNVLMDGAEVDHFLTYSGSPRTVKKLTCVIKLWWVLLRMHFDVAVCLLPSDRTARQIWRDKLFFRLSCVPRVVGFIAFSRKELFPLGADGHPGWVRHEAICRLERLQHCGIDVSKELDLSVPFLKIPQTGVSEARQWIMSQGLKQGKPIVAICPGSKQPANVWPLDRFIAIGIRLAGTCKYELVVVGGPAETSAGEFMTRAWGTGHNAAGCLSVLGSAALLSKCAFCIGLDTGTTHLAAASGVPCVALYGARDNPGRFEPLGGKHIVLRVNVLCAGCRVIEKQCPVAGHPCMSGIDVEMVWQAVLKMEQRIV